MKYALTTIAMAAIASSQAAVVIDSFDNPISGQSVLFTDPTGPDFKTDTASGLAGVLGGARIISGEITSGGIGAMEVGANLTAGLFTIANSSQDIKGRGGIIWDGDSPDGLNYDLSECQVIRWGYQNDKPTTYTLTLWTYDLVTGGVSHPESLPVPAGASGIASIPLWKYALAGVNLTDVDWIELAVDPEAGGNVAISVVECDIPEPATTGLAFAALAGLGTVMRRFRKA